MSTWHDTQLEDMGIDPDNPEILIIQVDPDYGGNVYANVKISDLEEVIKKKLMWMRKTKQGE